MDSGLGSTSRPGMTAGLDQTLTLQERIALPLLANSAHGTVAADEGDVVAERQELVLDRADQRLAVAAGKIHAPDGALEEHVTHKGKALILRYENHAARRVAWA